MSTLTLGLAGLAGLSAFLYGPATHSTLTKLGVFRSLDDEPAAASSSSSAAWQQGGDESIHIIDDTVHCEDIHYYAPGHTLFTACEDVNTTRFEWFPPLGVCSGADAAVQKQGSIHVIDPETHTSTRLAFENFHGPFITHGIDVIPASAADPSAAVYIFAVNHIPGADSLLLSSSSASSSPADKKETTTTTNNDKNKNKNKCHLASRIDVFHHTLGTTTARYLHSIAHPLIRTPNDVYGVSANEVYVTNDRWYEGGFLHIVESLWSGAKWSDVVYARRVAVEEEQQQQQQQQQQEEEAEQQQKHQVKANIAIGKLHNPNGIGHGRTDDEILIASALGGVLWLGSLSHPSSLASSSSSSSSSDDNEAHSSSATEPTIHLNGTVDFASAVDNPSWYQDPYVSDNNNNNDDASGFVLAGVKRGINLGTTANDPHGREGVMVWHVKPDAELPAEKWEKKLLWEDNGRLIRNAATAVLVGIDPAKETTTTSGGVGKAGGGKKAWLYVTGFSSQNTVAVKVDL